MHASADLLAFSKAWGRTFLSMGEETSNFHNKAPRTLDSMAAVYKTLSGSSAHDTEHESRKNKQRVLILVCDARKSVGLRLIFHIELERRHVQTPASSPGSVLVDVS